MKKILKTTEREDGKVEYLDENYVTYIFDPAVCTPKHFYRETGIDTGHEELDGYDVQKISNNEMSVTMIGRCVFIRVGDETEQLSVYFGTHSRSCRAWLKKGSPKFEFKTSRV